MKLIFTTLICLFLAIGSLIAQSNWEAGIRFGDKFAVDFTIPLANAPRLHPTVYFGNHIAVGAYFDWVFALSGGPTGLKFYPGVGPELYFNNGLDFAGAGNFGVEYSFKFPLTIGFDWRPHIMFTNDFNFNTDNWGIMARFRFGEGVKFERVE